VIYGIRVVFGRYGSTCEVLVNGISAIPGRFSRGRSSIRKIGVRIGRRARTSSPLQVEVGILTLDQFFQLFDGCPFDLAGDARPEDVCALSSDRTVNSKSKRIAWTWTWVKTRASLCLTTCLRSTFVLQNHPVRAARSRERRCRKEVQVDVRPLRTCPVMSCR